MKEIQIQNMITNYLQLKENLWEPYFFRSWAWAVKVNNPNGKDRFFKSWKAGCPDVTVCKDWRFIWLEVKTKIWRQSDSQKQAEDRMRWGVLKKWLV